MRRLILICSSFFPETYWSKSTAPRWRMVSRRGCPFWTMTAWSSRYRFLRPSRSRTARRRRSSSTPLSRYWPAELQVGGKPGFAGPFRTRLDLPEVAALTQRLLAKDSVLRQLLPGLQPEQQRTRNYSTWNALGLWLERDTGLLPDERRGHRGKRGKSGLTTEVVNDIARAGM